MRKALIVGIDYYTELGCLSGCVNDAYAVKTVLERHADGTLNFPNPQALIGESTTQDVCKRELKEAVRELFSDDAEIALFYFAGHGHIEDTGGFLCASDSKTGDDGLALSELMTWANTSKAKIQNKVIILDSCHSGVAGNNPIATGLAEISDGMTILAASAANQYALETPGAGVFTSLFVDALNGAAANLVGEITPGSVYAHIDQSLGPWTQRPVFKTNVKRFVSLRRTEPPIELTDLQALIRLFPSPDYDFGLDPTFEPERTLDDERLPKPNPENTAKFRVLQNYARVNLARPVGAPHMWHAAMHSKGCQLTALGQHYWNLVKKERI